MTRALHNLSPVLINRLGCTTLARYCTCAALLLLPFSHFLVNQFAIAAVVLGVLSADYRQKWQVLKNQPAVFVSLAFLALLFISIFYSVASLHHAVSWFCKYTKILYIIPLLPLFTEAKHRKTALDSFIVGVTVSAFLSFLAMHYWINLSFTLQHPRIFPNSGVYGMFVNILNMSVLSAFAAFLLLNRIFDQNRIWLYLPIVLFLVYQMTFINGERTGCAIFFVLLTLSLWQRWHWRGLLSACIVVPVLATVFVLYAPALSHRIHLGVHAVKNLQVAQTVTTTNAALSPAVSSLKTSAKPIAHSSLYYRLHFWKTSLDIIKQAPLLGHGVGSFISLYNQAHGLLFIGSKDLEEPHNSYLFVAVQVGIVGALLFIAWLFAMWRTAAKLPVSDRHLMQGMVLCFALNACINVTIAGNTMGNLYVLTAAVLLAALRGINKNEQHSSVDTDRAIDAR